MIPVKTWEVSSPVTGVGLEGAYQDSAIKDIICLEINIVQKFQGPILTYMTTTLVNSMVKLLSLQVGNLAFDWISFLPKVVLSI